MGKIKLMIATTNASKIKEISDALKNNSIISDNYDIYKLNDANKLYESPREDSDTVMGNSIIKAKFYSRYYVDYVVISDDTGLFIDVLNGEPGVHSNRYKGARNIKETMKNILWELASINENTISVDKSVDAVLETSITIGILSDMTGLSSIIYNSTKYTRGRYIPMIDEDKKLDSEVDTLYHHHFIADGDKKVIAHGITPRAKAMKDIVSFLVQQVTEK